MNDADAAKISEPSSEAAGQLAAVPIDTKTSIFGFVLALAVLYGLARLISPFSTLVALVVLLAMAAAPKQAANDPRLALSPSMVRRLSLLCSLIMFIIGFVQIANYADASELTPQEAAEIRQKNLNEIRTIEAELKQIPAEAADLNNDRYAKLTALDPGNAAYAAKAAHYREEAEKLQYLRDHPAEALELVKTAWTKSTGFGNIPVMSFTIKNSAGWTIRDPEVTCHFYGASHTQINALTKTIYEEIKAGQTRTFKNQSMGFISADDTKSVSCEISAANR